MPVYDSDCCCCPTLFVPPTAGSVAAFLFPSGQAYHVHETNAGQGSAARISDGTILVDRSSTDITRYDYKGTELSRATETQNEIQSGCGVGLYLARSPGRFSTKFYDAAGSVVTVSADLYDPTNTARRTYVEFGLRDKSYLFHGWSEGSGGGFSAVNPVVGWALSTASGSTTYGYENSDYDFTSAQAANQGYAEWQRSQGAFIPVFPPTADGCDCIATFNWNSVPSGTKAHIARFDSNGNEVWRTQMSVGATSTDNCVMCDDGTDVYVYSEDSFASFPNNSRISSFSISDGTENWTVEITSNSTPIHLATTGGVIAYADSAGTRIYSTSTGSLVAGSLTGTQCCALNGSIYTQNEDGTGTLRRYAPDGTEVWSISPNINTYVIEPITPRSTETRLLISYNHRSTPPAPA